MRVLLLLSLLVDADFVRADAAEGLVTTLRAFAAHYAAHPDDTNLTAQAEAVAHGSSLTIQNIQEQRTLMLEIVTAVSSNTPTDELEWYGLWLTESELDLLEGRALEGLVPFV